MLRQRVLSALIFVPLFLGLEWLGGMVFNVFLAVILVFAGSEYSPCSAIQATRFLLRW